MREEKDFLGSVSIPDNAYWGIHTYRAKQNFSVSGYKIPSEFIKAYGLVKQACLETAYELGSIDSEKYSVLNMACVELSEGLLNEYIVVDAIQGGAGTSLNMNVNEVIANRALELAGKKFGDYEYIDPVETVNIFQSTNDTYPTALKVAAISLLRKLEQSVIALLDAFQSKEKEFADIVKVGRTQLTDAVLITLGSEFSAYSEAIARDRWRIYKCEERLRVVNLGGTAVGTGIGAPRKYIFKVVDKLRNSTGMGLARAENLIDSTQNLDVFAEVSGILKALAVNLVKVSNDLRLLSSGPYAGLGEIKLPPVQAGSSIMPGKVNPVIPELVAQIGMKVIGNDAVINNCAAFGQLELNQNTPLLAFTFLESLELLINGCDVFRQRCIEGITANEDNIKNMVNSSTACLNALVCRLGYNKVAEIAKLYEKSDISLKEFIIKNDYLTEEEFEFLTSAETVLALGYR
ncbi:MAG: aspartate ammonia-lyase [bacterium]